MKTYISNCCGSKPFQGNMLLFRCATCLHICSWDQVQVDAPVHETTSRDLGDIYESEREMYADRRKRMF